MFSNSSSNDKIIFKSFDIYLLYLSGLGNAIIAIATQYSAGSIVLPKLDNIRELINSEIHLIAEEKCPGCIEAQKNYAKEYRRSVNQWSYRRLLENLESQAAKTGIAIEISQQTIKGSPQEKARELALVAYNSRKKS